MGGMHTYEQYCALFKVVESRESFHCGNLVFKDFLE